MHLRPWIWVVFFLGIGASSLQAEDLCQSLVRTVRLSPDCLARDQSQCPDLCSGLEPDLEPKCFQEVELPCPLVQDMKQGSNAAGRPWIRLADIFRYYQFKLDDSFIALSLMSYTLTDRDFSALNQVDLGLSTVARENFKLTVRADAQNLARILNQYAAAKNRSAAQDFSSLIEVQLAPAYRNRIRQNLLLSADERTALLTDFDGVVTKALDQWHRLSQQFARRSFVDVRRRAVMSQLSRLRGTAAQLSPSIQTTLSAVIEPMSLVNCRLAEPDSCEIKDLAVYADDDLPAVDRYLDSLERVLGALQNHGIVLSGTRVISVDDSPFPDYASNPSAYSMDSFKVPELLRKTFQEFVLKPDDLEFLRLKAAVAAGAYQEFFNADEIWRKVLSSFEVKQGFALLKPDPGLQKLSCESLREDSRQAQELQAIMDGKMAEMAALVWNGKGLSKPQELVFQRLVDELRVLADRKLALITTNQMAFDRLVEFRWPLPSSLPPGSRLYLDFVQVDRPFWSPNIPVRLSDIFPDIGDVSSEFGSLKDGGMVPLGVRGSIKLSLKQAPFDACARDLPVRLIVRVDDPDGGVHRIRLEAKHFKE